jgi:hypothetical protein
MQSPNNEIAKTNEIVTDLIVENFSSLQDQEFNQKLIEKIQLWENSTRQHLANTNPFEKHRVKLVSSEWDFKAHGGCEKSVKSDLAEYKLFSSEANTQFWQDKLSAFKKEAKKTSEDQKSLMDALRRNEQEAWRKDYERKLLEWQLNEIQGKRNAFFKRTSGMARYH